MVELQTLLAATFVGAATKIEARDRQIAELAEAASDSDAPRRRGFNFQFLKVDA
jgi:hypothetical protein